jgi:hypothetical protein
MQIRKSDGRIPLIVTRPATRSFEFHISIFVLLLLAGCAAPSEPYERKPPVAEPVSDLAATQSADDVILTFTLPTQTVDRLPLKEPLAIEIYRGIGAPGSDSREHMSLLATVPAAGVAQYAAQGHVRYVDSLRPEDFAGRDSVGAIYAIRTRASEKRDSDPSNLAYLLLRPAPDPIADLKAQVTHPAIVLTWTQPERSLTGSAPSVAGYRIYRAEIEPVTPGAAETPSLKAPLAKIGDSESPSFRDAQFDFGKTYEYSVRSITGSGEEAIESADSNLAVVAALDTFPPAAPLGLVIAFVPQQAETPAHLELSWAISPETDVAGYNVYRSEQAGNAGARVNTELLLTPAFRDMNVQPGHRYFYSATAVDRSGNESPASEVASGSVPAESQPTP